MATYRPSLSHTSTAVLSCSSNINSSSNKSSSYNRPPFGHSPISAPSSISVESITKDKNKVESLLSSSSLPNRPANSLQQQYSHSKAKAGSKRVRGCIEEDSQEQNHPPANAGYASSVLYYNSPLLKQHQQQHQQKQKQQDQKQQDPVISTIASSSSSSSLSSSHSTTTNTPQRPILTSKFSFDNLTLAGDAMTAADNNSSINVGAALAPIKKMVTPKTWLQNITNAARNSTISSSSVSSPPAQTSSSSISSNSTTSPYQNHHQQQASISSTCSATSSTTGRQEQQISSASSSSYSNSPSSALQRFRKKSTSPIRASFPSSSPPSSSSTSQNAMVISNPELVHANGNLPNMTLGAGARRIGRQAEIFGNMPNHRMYTAPSSPPPRSSEDSVRSLASSTSGTSSHTQASFASAGSMASSSATAVSHSSSSAISVAASCSSSSFGQSRRERDLPYLPLRVRTIANQQGVASSPSSLSLNGGDAVEQLASTPSLPDSAKYILRAVQLAEENEQREEQKGQEVLTTAPNSSSMSPSKARSGSSTREEEIPFGHSATSRPSSLISPSRVKGDEIHSSNSSLSPGRSSFHHFARRECLPDTFASRSITSNEAAAKSMPNLASPTSSKTIGEPSSSSPKLKKTDVNALPSSTMASSSKPFAAILLSSPSPSSEALSDAQRLVTVYPGGNRAFTTTLQSLRSQPDSHLARFVEESLVEGQKDVVFTSPVQPLQSASLAPISSASSKEAHMSDTYIKPTQVTLHLPNSPIGALRSARASIYDDVPSDEGEQDDTEYAFFAEAKPCSGDRLEVPLPRFPNPRQTRLRFSRIPSSGQVSSASEYTNSEADQDALNSFIDTTPDDEMNDPFHFQRDESPMSAMHEDGKSAPTSTHHNGDSSEVTAKENTSPVLSHYSSHPPSLSSSPNSSAFQGGSPIRFSTVAGRLDTKSPFESLLASQESGLQKHISIYLDRSPESYESIFHYLRVGSLPRRLCMILHSGEVAVPSQCDNVMLLRSIEALSKEARREVLPLLFQPVLAELSDLREEAQYLGFTSLVNLCNKEVEKLHAALAPQRKIVAHPIKTSSKTSVTDLSVAKTHGASPVQTASGHRLNSNGPRPRFTGHRAIASESKVILKLTPRIRSASQDNWI